MKNLGVSIADEAVKFVRARVPYQHRGMSMFGCDCTGLLIAVFHRLGLFRQYKLRVYKLDWNLNAGADDYIREELGKVAIRVPNSQLQVGDVLVFRFGRCAAHVGVFIKPNVFAHCYKEQGRCCYGTLESSPWGRRWISTYRFDEEKVLRANKYG